MYWRHYIFILSAAIIISLITGCRQLLEGTSDPGSVITNSDTVEKIVVSSPVRGDTYKPGESIQIKWITSSSSVSYIDIYLYRKSTLKRTIANGIVNHGSYVWQIPHVIDNSIHYTVKVVNSYNPEVFNYSGRFGILEYIQKN
jgi:hypothetical protein